MENETEFQIIAGAMSEKETDECNLANEDDRTVVCTCRYT